ncbi:MAG: hypothetical protein II243_02945 [Lachnospiraceae bacterium]|nr:hypothetical protein [Lachnospiraceae bacterium]
MRIKDIIRTFSAALVLSVCVGSSSHSLQAASNEAVVYAEELNTVTSTLGQTKTFPVDIDPTQFNLAGSWRYIANAEGNPDIQIIQNAPDLYTMAMYEGTGILLDFNNPAYNQWYDEIGIANDYYNDPVFEIVSCIDDASLLDGTDCTIINNQHQMLLEAIKPGTATIQVGVINCNPYYVHDDFEPVKPITIAIVVLPRMPGAQAPTYSHRQWGHKDLYDAGLL